ncbi:GNAT family N-acetyltransferase [Brassicibacter mesophilus]|uniref:GNAT family N-acetyltransferase n=1 Tax=Brassicibacter mesophilus TaxID=745119 RepID=UPI003D1B0CEE
MAWTGRGLARNMLRIAIQFGKDSGLPKASLEVDVKNKDALTLYTNEGFEKLYGLAVYLYHLQ